VRVPIGSGHWRLLAQRAAFNEQARLLAVADVHYGKGATFRARGVPVPAGSHDDNLLRLTRLIEATRPRTLAVLGDLFHAREALDAAGIDAFRAWRCVHADVEVVLVEGNHDAAAGVPHERLGIRVEREPWDAGGALLAHHPQAHAGRAVLAGHLHPAIRLSGRADRGGVRVPCFWLRDGLALLPAFGEFTGAATIRREAGDRVIAVADDRLFEIPG
jgi:DNA ligase-associated metallophosphoesterase